MSKEGYQLVTQKTDLRISARYNNLYSYDVEVSAYSYNNITKYELTGGYAVEIFNEIIQLFHLSYEIVSEISVSDISKASEYNIDLFVGSFALHGSGLAEAVQPSFVTGHSKVVAFINHSFEDNEHDIIWIPFDFTLRMCWLILFCLFATTSAIFGRFENFSVSESIFHSITIFLNKNSNLNFKKLCSRIALWTTSLTFSVIWASYSGDLVSTLAVARYSVNSLESLLKSHYAVLLERGYNNGSSIQEIAKALANSEVMSHFLQKSKESGFIFESFDRSIMKVRDTPSAYVVDEETGISSILNTIEYFPCKWGKIAIYDIKYPWCMYLRKDSPSKSNINLGLLKLSQHGILKRIHAKWIPRFYGCRRDSLLTDIPILGLRQLRSVFYVIILGLISSLLSLVIVENLMFLRERKKWIANNL